MTSLDVQMNPIHLKEMSSDPKRRGAIPWTALRVFEAASRLGSFKAAAEELAVTPTAVSHQVKRLETHLGQSLFERLHRALLLTPAGKVLAKDVQASFQRFEATLDRLRLQGGVAGPDSLTVSVVPSFATKWLAPRLSDFQSKHPTIGLEILADQVLVDLRRNRTIDIALRYGPGPHAAALHAERLWPQGEIVAVCAPALAKDTSLRRPAGLVRHLLIRTAALPAAPRSKQAGPGSDWPTWLAAAGVPIDAAMHRALGPIFSASQLAIEAAAAGRGIALAPTVLVEGDIAAGRLVRLFRHSIPDPNTFWALCRADRLRERRIQIFLRWLRTEAARVQRIRAPKSAGLTA